MSSKEEKEALLAELEARTTARGFLNYAHEYYASYELIQKQHPKITDFFAVKFYLLCHSLELVMKAWLRHKGATYNELKGFSHDLEKIMVVLHDKHKLLFDARSQQMISLVNQLYSKKEFEYSLRGAKTVPEITDLASTVSLLMGKARFDILLDGDPRKLRALSENAK